MVLNREIRDRPIWTNHASELEGSELGLSSLGVPLTTASYYFGGKMQIAIGGFAKSGQLAKFVDVERADNVLHVDQVVV